MQTLRLTLPQLVRLPDNSLVVTGAHGSGDVSVAYPTSTHTPGRQRDPCLLTFCVRCASPRRTHYVLQSSDHEYALYAVNLESRENSVILEHKRTVCKTASNALRGIAVNDFGVVALCVDAQNPVPFVSFEPHPMTVLSTVDRRIAFSPDGTRALMHRNENVELAVVEDGLRVYAHIDSPSTPVDVQYAGNDACVCAFADGCVRLHSTADGSVLYVFSLRCTWTPRFICVSPAGSDLAVFTERGLRVWRTDVDRNIVNVKSETHEMTVARHGTWQDTCDVLAFVSDTKFSKFNFDNSRKMTRDTFCAMHRVVLVARPRAVSVRRIPFHMSIPACTHVVNDCELAPV